MPGSRMLQFFSAQAAGADARGSMRRVPVAFDQRGSACGGEYCARRAERTDGQLQVLDLERCPLPVLDELARKGSDVLDKVLGDVLQHLRW